VIRVVSIDALLEYCNRWNKVAKTRKNWTYDVWM